MEGILFLDLSVEDAKECCNHAEITADISRYDHAVSVNPN